MPDFLVLRYRECDFLCPRDEVLGSSVRRVQGGLVSYGGLWLPEIDLDGCLKKSFPHISSHATELSLICRASGSDEALVALRVVSESFVASYPYSEFRLLPFLVRARMRQHGILATRCLEDRMEYLMDLWTLLRETAQTARVSS